jgi:hypothetical protein
MPYWASAMLELNCQGLRGKYELPRLVNDCRFVPDVEANRALIRSSVSKAAFQRKTAQEWIRSRSQISGYVLSGWRDTPISSAGFFDDWNASRFDPSDVLKWNSEDCLYLIPQRHLASVNGGDRVGWADSLNVFVGRQVWRVGLHAERGTSGGLVWRILDEGGVRVANGVGTAVSIARSEVGLIEWTAETSGSYRIEVEFGNAKNAWPISVIDPLDPAKLVNWSLEDPRDLVSELTLSGKARRLVIGNLSSLEGSGIALLVDEGTRAAPFWREAAYEFQEEAFWDAVPFRENWSRLLPICSDCVIDRSWLEEMLPKGATLEVLMNRISTQDYEELPVLVRVTLPDGAMWIITTLRPFGGIGNQPGSLATNAAGSLLLQNLVGLFK